MKIRLSIRCAISGLLLAAAVTAIADPKKPLKDYQLQSALDANGQQISNLPSPSAANDAVRKAYVDAFASDPASVEDFNAFNWRSGLGWTGLGNLSLSGNFTTSGLGHVTLTIAGATNLTLPTSGTLETTAGATAKVTTLAATPTEAGGFAAPAWKDSLGVFDNELRAWWWLWKQIRTAIATPAGNYIGIASYGDSVAARVANNIAGTLETTFGGGSLNSDSLAMGNPLTTSTSGTITYNGPATAVHSRDFSYLPSGAHYMLADGATISFSAKALERNGFTLATAYYLTRPGDGDLLIELVNGDTSAVIASSTVDCDAALGLQKVVFTHAAGSTWTTTTKPILRFTSTGTAVVIGARMIGARGVSRLGLNVGGSTLTENNTSNATILQALCTEFGVSMMFSEFKEEDPASSFGPTFSRWGALTGLNLCIIGSAPDNNTEASQRLIIDDLRARAAAAGMMFVDGYRLLKNFATVTGLSWQNDGTHLQEPAYQFVAQWLAARWGLTAILGAPMGAPVRSASVAATTLNYSDAAQISSDITLMDLYQAPDRVRFRGARRYHFLDPGAGPYFDYANSSGVQLKASDDTPAALFLKTVRLNDANNSHQLSLSWPEDDTGNRTLSFGVNGANRVVTLRGSAFLGGLETQSGSVTLTPASAEYQVYTGTGGDTLTLFNPSGFAGWPVTIKNRGAGNLTVAKPSGSDNIYEGATAVGSITVASGASVTLVSDGAGWNVMP